MNSNDKKTTDLVLTLTPHIIRIPDVTEEDVTPYFVGTDANISYQGGPRVENPTRDQGPFEAQPGETQAQPPQAAAARRPRAIPPINLSPASAPSDIFRPAPAPSAPPGCSAAAGAAAGSGAADFVDGSPRRSGREVGSRRVAGRAPRLRSRVHFGRPRRRADDPGARDGGRRLPGGTIAIRFDPTVVAALSVEADPRQRLRAWRRVASTRRPHRSRVPGRESLSGTRALAEITRARHRARAARRSRSIRSISAASR